ncbi:unnamed protein product [Calypogeia fissa]
MGSGGKDEKMEDATAGRKGGEEGAGGGGGDGKLKDKEVGQFSEGDKVLAYHGPLIYEAKIQRAEFRKKEWKYFVHYLGWSKNWDEWVGTDRLMALTDKNLEMQKQLFKNQNVDKQSKGRLPQGRQKAPTDTKGEKEVAKINPASVNAVPKGKKRKADSTVSEEKDTDEPDHVMKIPMPAVLKKQLVDDWELIQSGKSIKLPRSPNVEDILKKYREFKTKRESLDGDSLGEVLNGLQCYFNKALPAMLLYKQERAQYAGAVPDGSKPSLIYGAEHLLRLFVKLPELLVYTNMEEETLTQLQQKLMDFLKFLQKHQSSFFLSMYDGPKGGARIEPEEKKLKRDSTRSSEDRKDRSDVLKPVEDKREKRVGTKAVEDRREKKDGSKSSDDKNDRKETSKVIEEKKDRKDGQRSSEDKREKKDAQAPKASEEKKERKDGSKALEDKKEKKDNSKPSDDKKEKTDGSKPLDNKKENESSKSLDDKKEKDSSKSVDEKKEKKDTSKSSDEKKEKDTSNSSDEKKEKKDTSKSLDEKKEKKETSKLLDEKKEKKDTAKSLDEKKEKKDTSKSSDEKKEKDEDASVISS